MIRPLLKYIFLLPSIYLHYKGLEFFVLYGIKKMTNIISLACFWLYIYIFSATDTFLIGRVKLREYRRWTYFTLDWFRHWFGLLFSSVFLPFVRPSSRKTLFIEIHIGLRLWPFAAVLQCTHPYHSTTLPQPICVAAEKVHLYFVRFYFLFHNITTSVDSEIFKTF